jgi:hypothetical protein
MFSFSAFASFLQNNE